jgi:protein-S-isoprenylcysteine O-methyltransferase Ste14
VRVLESVQRKNGRARDRGTRVLIAVSIGVAIFVAARASSSSAPPAVRAAGVAVMWVGLAVRGWAIATLGRSFRTTVEVDPGQAVITSGPYRWIRHPSYAGLLLILLGFGLASGDWLSLAVCVLLPLPAFVRRVQVEEAELSRVLGDAYRAYQARTSRLIPGVW